MKITKRQLRRIIKEEKAKLLKEEVPTSVRHEQLAVEGADEALSHIQQALGIESGDLAGQWEGWDKLVEVLTQYINFEETYGSDARGPSVDSSDEPGQGYSGIS